ncbi:MAG TPA: hypothetical protein VLC93_04060 [Myxococcota bacterium]|nr:hypothetical protein [Myxococcota bacterium]
MSMKAAGVELGINIAKQIAGDEGAATATIAAARVAGKTRRVVKRARKVLDDVDTGKRAPKGEGKAKSIEGSAATTAGAAPNLQAALAGALAAFKQSAGTPVAVSPQTDEALARVSEKVKGTSLIVADQARQLATVAEGLTPRPVGVGFRIWRKRASPDDIAAAIGFTENVHGGVAGWLKGKGFAQSLRRMKDNPDPRVFKLLDFFSNSCEERLKALGSISDAILDMKIDAATTLEVLDGFNNTQGKANYPFRVEALKVLAKHIESRVIATEVVARFAKDDESARLAAFEAIVSKYNGMSADEICAFLVLFDDQRSQARKLVQGKLTEPEKMGQINALFADEPKLIDAHEVVQLRENVGRLLSTAGATGKALFAGFRAAASKK